MNTPTTQREAVDLRRLVHRFCVLADIPNQEGFRFIGKDHDGELIPCIVKKNPAGCHGAYDERDGAPCFMRLEAWSAYSANKIMNLKQTELHEYAGRCGTCAHWTPLKTDSKMGICHFLVGGRTCDPVSTEVTFWCAKHEQSTYEPKTN